MNPEQAQDTAGRDQLWASLRALRPEIDRIAASDFDSSERERQLTVVLARVVVAEMDFRARDAGSAT
jgi:hypothetical protein